MNLSGYNTAICSNTGSLSVTGCNITTNNVSIFVDVSGDLSGVSLENNTIVSFGSDDSSSSSAVYITATTSTCSVSIKNNDIANIMYMVLGVCFYVSYFDNSLLFENNKFTGIVDGVRVSVSIGNSTIIFTNNNFSVQGSGVSLSASSGNTTIIFTNNDFTGTDCVVYLSVYGCNNNISMSFVGNDITGNDYAMYISSYGSFSGLSLLNNTFNSDDVSLYFDFYGF